MIKIYDKSLNNIHIRYNGRAHSIAAEDLDIDGSITGPELLSAVEKILDIRDKSLEKFIIDFCKDSGNATVRPISILI